MSKDLKIYPFGGVGEIGSNMTIFETKNNLVIIDYGILFPYEDFFDINYLIADTSQLNREKKLTLFITHGHEDHIGAVSHLVTEFPEIEIYAPKFASLLIRTKLEKRKISKKIHVYEEDSQLKFDGFTLDPVHVTHSIPETYGLIFSSKDFATLFISDFKYDLTPSFERPFNVQKIKNIFKTKSATMAMLDSTNILGKGKTTSEADLIHDLEKLMLNEKRTFITMFSSNIYRVKNILEIAKKNSLKVTTIGRSLNHYIEIANEAGLLIKDDYPLIEFDAIQNYNDPKVIYLVTGSQGEHLGATRRIVIGEQKHINLSSDDQFIFSSKPIPGNEKKVYRLYNILAEKNVSIVNSSTHLVHASGHPCQDDLNSLISEIQPNFYIPIHGETYFLRKHVEFISEKFPMIQPIYLQNFEGVKIKDGIPQKFELEQMDPHLIHGNDIPIEREKISERRKMANAGVVFISINHKSQNINVTTKGIPGEFEVELPKVKDLVDYCVFVENKKRDYDYTTEQVRIKIRTFYKSLLGYKPVTMVQMV